MKETYYAYQSVCLNVDYYPQPDDVRTQKFGRLIKCFNNKWSAPEPRPFTDKSKDKVLDHILKDYL